MPLSGQANLKGRFRSKYLEMRKAMSPDEKAELDAEIFTGFIRLDEYRSCKTLLIYASGSIEVGTRKIIGKALADGKRVALPVCLDKQGNMDFYRIDSPDCLEKGTFGIDEPKHGCARLIDFSGSLCVVPGLGFDLMGFRLGFGKGYYDRFLERYKGLSVGLCYSAFVSEELPRDVCDKSVDILVTESTVYEIPKE